MSFLIFCNICFSFENMTVDILYLVINILTILEKNYSTNYITFSNYENN